MIRIKNKMRRDKYFSLGDALVSRGFLGGVHDLAQDDGRCGGDPLGNQCLINFNPYASQNIGCENQRCEFSDEFVDVAHINNFAVSHDVKNNIRTLNTKALGDSLFRALKLDPTISLTPVPGTRGRSVATVEDFIWSNKEGVVQNAVDLALTTHSDNILRIHEVTPGGLSRVSEVPGINGNISIDKCAGIAYIHGYNGKFHMIDFNDIQHPLELNNPDPGLDPFEVTGIGPGISLNGNTNAEHVVYLNSRDGIAVINTGVCSKVGQECLGGGGNIGEQGLRVNGCPGNKVQKASIQGGSANGQEVLGIRLKAEENQTSEAVVFEAIFNTECNDGTAFLNYGDGTQKEFDIKNMNVLNVLEKHDYLPGTYTATFTVQCGNCAAKKRIPIAVVQLDLDTDLNYDGNIDSDDENLEDISGAYIIFNSNDDDLDDVLDFNDGMVRRNTDIIGSRDEGDLKKFKISFSPDFRSGKITLKAKNNRIQVFSDKRKGIRQDFDTRILGDDGQKTWNLSVTDQREDFYNLMNNDLWVEGVDISEDVGDTGLTLQYVSPERSGATLFDDVKITAIGLEIRGFSLSETYARLPACSVKRHQSKTLVEIGPELLEDLEVVYSFKAGTDNYDATIDPQTGIITPGENKSGEVIVRAEFAQYPGIYSEKPFLIKARPLGIKSSRMEIAKKLPVGVGPGFTYGANWWHTYSGTGGSLEGIKIFEKIDSDQNNKFIDRPVLGYSNWILNEKGEVISNPDGYSTVGSKVNINDFLPSTPENGKPGLPHTDIHNQQYIWWCPLEIGEYWSRNKPNFVFTNSSSIEGTLFEKNENFFFKTEAYGLNIIEDYVGSPLE